MGLSDGASGVRFHEYLQIIEQTKPKVAEGDENDDEQVGMALPGAALIAGAQIDV
jgi:hypothetical protein